MNKVICMQEIHRRKPFRQMAAMRFRGKTLLIGQQNFGNSTVPVREGFNGPVHNCPIGNEDGDIYFLFRGERLYFRYAE